MYCTVYSASYSVTIIIEADTLNIYFSFYNEYTYTITILKTFAEAHLHILTAAGSAGGTSMGCRVENRTRPALQQASALPSELRCTLKRRTAFYWQLSYHDILTRTGP